MNRSPATFLLTTLGAMAIALPAAAQTATEADTWRFTLGAGVISKPEFPGSDQRETQAVPLIGATYGRWFLGGVPGAGVPFGAGVHLVQSPRWKLGVAIGAGLGKARDEGDDPRLAGLGSIDNTTRLAAFGQFTEQWFTARAGLSTDVGGNHQGTLATLDLEARWAVNDQLSLSAGPGLTLADRRYSQTFYGIDAAQSARSGRPTYQAGAGLESLRFTVGADFRLTSAWGLGARATLSRLRGDAADSPITQDTAQDSVGVFASYRF